MPSYPKPTRRKKNKTRLIPVFISIWEKREHISQLSGVPLLPRHNLMWHWQFLHVLGKQRYPEATNKEWNIILALPEEHQKQETFSDFRRYQDYLKSTLSQGEEPDESWWENRRN